MPTLSDLSKFAANVRVPRNGLLLSRTQTSSFSYLYTVANMLHSIENKPSCASTGMPTFYVIKPAPNEALSEWHGF